MKIRDRARWLPTALVLVGLVLLGRWSGVTIAAQRYQVEAERILEQLRLHATSDREGTVAGRTRDQALAKGIVGRMAIPRLGLTAMIGEGLTPRVLDRAVGHVPGSPFPGEPGNVGLAGHRDTYFRRLQGIHPRDLIRIATPDGEFSYRVVNTAVVDPHDAEVLRDQSFSGLTLVTCYPFNFLGSAPRRFIVRATQTSTDSARATTSGRALADLDPAPKAAAPTRTVRQTSQIRHIL
jgi:LPXTG-site transpeptidase (sortase) family protein